MQDPPVSACSKLQQLKLEKAFAVSTVVEIQLQVALMKLQHE